MGVAGERAGLGNIEEFHLSEPFFCKDECHFERNHPRIPVIKPATASPVPGGIAISPFYYANP